MKPGRSFRLLVVTVLFIGLITPPALAAFPYPAPPPGQDPYNYEDYMFLRDVPDTGTPAAPPPASPDYPPSDLEDDIWKYDHRTACEVYGPENPDPKFFNCSPLTKANPQEQHGVTGASVSKAWETTTGRPDVVIAVHDSGIRWNDGAYRVDLNNKTWLNRGELPVPDPAVGHPADPYDRNKDGVFNIKDYCQDWNDVKACGGAGHPSVIKDPTLDDADYNANGFIDPEDLIFIFSDGVDQDGNGYKDDFVGWDTYEDDNDPFDEVQYGHGTGEARDSTAETTPKGTPSEGGMAGTCPNCMVMHMRVGDSFIADVNDFAQGAIYATDNGASVIQSALGTLNNSRFAQEAIDYAYRRGVVLIASAADESAGHHNQPSVLEHAVTMNSIGEPQVPGAQPPSYLEFRGCTNYGAYITAAVPSNSCSSEAVGRSAGMAAMVYAAAKNMLAKKRDDPACAPLPTPLPSGSPAVPAYCGFEDYGVKDGPGGVPEGLGVSAEEIDQLVATTADDLSFTAPAPYTDRPNYPATKRYGATPGWDPFFGYGRINARRMVQAVVANRVPPEADITSPRWFEIVDPSSELIKIEGSVASRRTPKYSYEVQWALWKDSWLGPRENYKPPVWKDATEARTGDQTEPFSGVLATIPSSAIATAMGKIDGPAVDPTTGRGEKENLQLPDKFGVIARVVVTAKDASGTVVTTSFDAPEGGGDPNSDKANQPLIGVGTKNFNFHRDPALLPGFPKYLEADGAAAPRYADLDDDGADELIVATSNGEVHAFNADGSEVPGWPVYTSDAQYNYDAPAYRSDEITKAPDGKLHAAVLRSPAVGDLDRDGDLEVVVGDFMGRISAFDNKGQMLPGFPLRSNPDWSQPQRFDREGDYYGRHLYLMPGSYPRATDEKNAEGQVTRPALPMPNDPDVVPDLVNRHTQVNRVIWWMLAPPTLANIDPRDDDLEILAGGSDRHLYAFKARPGGFPCPVPEMGDGCVPGWPVFLRDPKRSLLESVDPRTHEITVASPRARYDGAKIVTAPAVADADGNGQLEVYVAVNEQYNEHINTDDPAIENLCRNPDDLPVGGFEPTRPRPDDIDNPRSIDPAIDCGNQRFYALYRDGNLHEGAKPDPTTGHPNPNAYVDFPATAEREWPVKVPSATLELLPVVGNGPDGSPVVGDVNGAGELEIAIFGTAGPALVVDRRGDSIYGKQTDRCDDGERECFDDRTLLTATRGEDSNSNSPDSPTIPGLGGGIFSTIGPGALTFAATAVGLGKLVDVILPEDQLVSDNQLALWDLNPTRTQTAAFPREVNDLQFLTTPASAEIDGAGSQEILAGTAYSDLHAFDVTGNEPGLKTLAPDGWPKFTAGWSVAPPSVGDLDDDGKRDVAHVIREGELFVWRGNGAGVCAPATWPEYGHDPWMTNNEDTDAQRPRIITDLRAQSLGDGRTGLVWTAPGDDGTCRQAHHYEIRRSDQPITNENFNSAVLLGKRVAGSPGSGESFASAAVCGTAHYAVRTWDADETSDTPAHPANPSAVRSIEVTSTAAGCTTPTPRPSTPSPSGSSPTVTPSGTVTTPPATQTPVRGQAATTIVASRSKVGYRKPFRLSGQVAGTAGCSGPYEVTVERRVHGRTASRQIRSSFRTDDDGTWTLRLRPRKSAGYTARVTSTSTCDGSESAPVDVKVKAAVRLGPPRCSTGRGTDGVGDATSFSLRGLVEPNHRGTKVRLEKRRGGGWKRIWVDRLGPRSRFHLRSGPGLRCPGSYRVVWPKQSPENLRGQARFRI